MKPRNPSCCEGDTMLLSMLIRNPREDKTFIAICTYSLAVLLVLDRTTAEESQEFAMH